MKEFSQSDIVTLHGSPRQRGRIHGETLRTKIQELISRWKEWLVTSAGGFTNQYIQELVCETRLLQAVQQWTPGLLDEVKGIAEGAKVDFNEIFAFQLQDEEWWFGQERKQGLIDPARHCTSLGWKIPTTLIAQNMDMPDYLDGYQVVLRVVDPQSEVEALVFSVAGLIALNGVNNYSIGIVCNNLSQLNHSRDGLPVAFIHRAALEKKSFLEAKSFLKTTPHASGQNYLLGGVNQLADLECSAHQVVEFDRSEGGSRMCHTNHPFVNSDFHATTPNAILANTDLKTLFITTDINSKTRFETTSDQLNKLDGMQVDIETAKKLLQSHDSDIYPVCRHSEPGYPWMTLGTTIMDLTPNPRLLVCPGPPCSSTFSVFDF